MNCDHQGPVTPSTASGAPHEHYVRWQHLSWKKKVRFFLIILFFDPSEAEPVTPSTADGAPLNAYKHDHPMDIVFKENVFAQHNI